MNQRAQEIFRMFGGKLVGTKYMQEYVCQTLSYMPDEIVNYITKNCWFLSSLDDAWAFTFTGNDLKDQSMIFLSDDLLHQDPNQIRYSIAHEIGHVILKHRNSVLEKQTKLEIKRQEEEADEFARKTLLPIP